MIFTYHTVNTKASKDFPNQRSIVTVENPEHPQQINNKNDNTNFHSTKDKNQKREKRNNTNNNMKEEHVPMR